LLYNAIYTGLLQLLNLYVSVIKSSKRRYAIKKLAKEKLRLYRLCKTDSCYKANYKTTAKMYEKL